MANISENSVFQYNLKRLLQENKKTQKDVAEAIGVSPQTFNTWCQGIALPRMGKLQALADYFKVNKSDLIELKTAPAASSELSEEGYLIGKAFDNADETDKNSVRRILRIENKEKGNISSAG